MSESARRILTNKDVIALNQDPLGIQAIRYMGGTKVEMYIKPLVNNEWAVLFLNRSDQAVDYEFKWADHYFDDDLNKVKVDFSKVVLDWSDLWIKSTGTTAKKFRQVIPAHDVVVLRLKPTR
jgi:alpha-galactosidase